MLLEPHERGHKPEFAIVSQQRELVQRHVLDVLTEAAPKRRSLPRSAGSDVIEDEVVDKGGSCEAGDCLLVQDATPEPGVAIERRRRIPLGEGERRPIFEDLLDGLLELEIAARTRSDKDLDVWALVGEDPELPDKDRVRPARVGAERVLEDHCR